MSDSLNAMQISPIEKSQQLMIIIKQQKNLWKCIKKSHKDIQQPSDNEHNCNGCEEETERKCVREREWAEWRTYMKRWCRRWAKITDNKEILSRTTQNKGKKVLQTITHNKKIPGCCWLFLCVFALALSLSPSLFVLFFRICSRSWPFFSALAISLFCLANCSAFVI